MSSTTFPARPPRPAVAVSRALLAGLLTALLALPLTAGGASAAPGERVASGLGKARVGGKTVLVDVVVAVPRGRSARAAVRDALRAQGARPFEGARLGSGGFALTGLVWDALPVSQNYNPSGEPASLGGQGRAALESTHTAWDGVTTSFFDIDFGQLTGRCPSLVRECPGPQSFDGANDVGWQRLDRRTLAVTWYGTATDEADMAFNVRVPWNGGCAEVDGSYDMETVALHENGHVVGLDHSDDADAIMFASYRAADCTLAQDDAEGATYLYPTQTATVSGTVLDAAGSPVEGARVALAGTSLAATTGADGGYAIAGVPYPVTYDVAASHPDHSGVTVRRRVDEDPETVDFSLEAQGGGGGGGGGGGPSCEGKKPGHPHCG